MKLFTAQSQNAQSVIICADWEEWESIVVGSGSGAVQLGMEQQPLTVFHIRVVAADSCAK